VRYLVDTDWIISGLGGIQSALTLLTRLAPDGLAISVIAEGEMLEGAYGRPDPANAIHHDIELVTRNRRHFERVPGLKLYEPDQT
jgi:predicted nucleic acid-binding protein